MGLGEGINFFLKFLINFSFVFNFFYKRSNGGEGWFDGKKAKKGDGQERKNQASVDSDIFSFFIYFFNLSKMFLIA